MRSATAPPVSSADASDGGWIRVLELGEIVAGEVVEVRAGTQSIAIVSTPDGLFAVDAVCPHAGGPLGDGHLDGCVLTCPWHGWTYDVRSGVSELDEAVSVRTWACQVRGDGVYVRESAVVA